MEHYWGGSDTQTRVQVLASVLLTIGLIVEDSMVPSAPLSFALIRVVKSRQRHEHASLHFRTCVLTESYMIPHQRLLSTSSFVPQRGVTEYYSGRADAAAAVKVRGDLKEAQEQWDVRELLSAATDGRRGR